MIARRTVRILSQVAAILLAACLIAPAARAQDGAPALPSLAPLVKRVLPSVVMLRATRPSATRWLPVDPLAGFPEAPLTREEEVFGAGVIVDAGLGLVATSNHVVERTDAITATLSDGRRIEAKLLASNADDDIAVLRISASGLSAVSLGDTASLEVGDFVVAIGDALGVGPSVTLGIVSALHRSCPGIGNADLVQTDAMIDQGNSGGPLISLRGELVGIDVARIGRGSGRGGFGFALPTGVIRRMLVQIRPD
jgi:S1-C subfamily serine protease